MALLRLGEPESRRDGSRRVGEPPSAGRHRRRRPGPSARRPREREPPIAARPACQRSAAGGGDPAVEMLATTATKSATAGWRWSRPADRRGSPGGPGQRRARGSAGRRAVSPGGRQCAILGVHTLPEGRIDTGPRSTGGRRAPGQTPPPPPPPLGRTTGAAGRRPPPRLSAIDRGRSMPRCSPPLDS